MFRKVSKCFGIFRNVSKTQSGRQGEINGYPGLEQARFFDAANYPGDRKPLVSTKKNATMNMDIVYNHYIHLVFRAPDHKTTSGSRTPGRMRKFFPKKKRRYDDV
jgi:hypothetical protein